MLQYTWYHKNIETMSHAEKVIKHFKKIKPTIGAFDTETTGLHIRKDIPFLFQFGYLHPTEALGYTFLLDLQRHPKVSKYLLKEWNKLATTLKKYFAHNVKFDLHMLANIGFPYKGDNLSDTAFYIRHAHPALTQKNGGPPMALKDYVTKFIDVAAKEHERMLTQEKTQITKQYNSDFKIKVKVCGKPPEQYNAKTYTLAVIDTIFKDCVFDFNTLPAPVQEVYNCWKKTLPTALAKKTTALVESKNIPYTLLKKENIYPYAHKDIVYVLETYLQTLPAIAAKETQNAIDIEEQLIRPLFDMERVGFKIDVDYLKECEIKTKEYIIQSRKQFVELMGEDLKIGQHTKIKKILKQKYNVNILSTGVEVLSKLEQGLPEDSPAKQVLALVQEMRTLEKWYTTYIQRFLKDVTKHNKLYTSINQVGTVTGRVSSDFQQFPQLPITTKTGEVLFHPRRLVTVEPEEYPTTLYIDYSQIELRIQAMYTILVGQADRNLCRAYMPFKCVHATKQINFDPSNEEHILMWKEDWRLEEDFDKKWKPVDVHGATTEHATGLTPDHPDFKKKRSEIGKRVNFAKNYGAQLSKIKEMFPEATEEEAKRIDGAYYKAFPGVKAYHNYCYGRALEYAYTENLFGIKYYNVNGHKLINMLIQGSAAFLLKTKIICLYQFMKVYQVKSKMQMNIHDEISWLIHKDESSDNILRMKQIMEHWEGTLVPIVADMELTTTTWADKKEVTNTNEIQKIISSRSFRKFSRR